MRDYFGKAPRTDVHPDEAVALGAAVQAGLKSGALAESGLIATDVAPFSMGISVLKETKGYQLRPGGFHVIIPRNTTIPVTRSDTFSTASEGQTSAEIEIYQGEHEWVKYNHKLGEFLLEGIPAKHAGAEVIEVTYRYNLNGILEVTAKCVSNGKAMAVTVQDALNRDTQEAFAESAAKLEALFNRGSDFEREDELGEDDFDEWEFEDESPDHQSDYYSLESDDSPTVLHAEAAALLERVQELVRDTEAEGQDRAQIEKLITSLQDTLAGEDIDRLQRVIDEATDLLIDLEV